MTLSEEKLTLDNADNATFIQIRISLEIFRKGKKEVRISYGNTNEYIFRSV